MRSWIKGRLKERTSLDGGALIAVGLVVLFLGPFATWAAYAATMIQHKTLLPSCVITMQN